MSENLPSMYPELSSSSIRLLGLREFPPSTPIQDQQIFKSQDRYKAYLNIKTDTRPQKYKRMMKQGIARIVVKKNLPC